MTQQITADGLSGVPFARRVLLLPHCLRPSQDCPGKMTKQGLDCAGCSLADCPIYRLRAVADEAGYGGVCVAPGGRLAVRFLAERQPSGVIAIACDEELEEGLEAIAEMEWSGGEPVVVTVPLTQDGCVDTEVDVPMAREIIISRNGSKET